MNPIQIPAATMHQVFALVEAAMAPAMSPRAFKPSTFAAYTIAGIPNGQQQKIVTTIDCHK